LDFKSTLPWFYEELEYSCITKGFHDLRGQLSRLRIKGQNSCEESNNASLVVIPYRARYLAERMIPSGFSQQLSVNLRQGRAEIVTDPYGRIAGFEIYNCPPLIKAIEMAEIPFITYECASCGVSL